MGQEQGPVQKDTLDVTQLTTKLLTMLDSVLAEKSTVPLGSTESRVCLQLAKDVAKAISILKAA